MTVGELLAAQEWPGLPERVQVKLIVCIVIYNLMEERLDEGKKAEEIMDEVRRLISTED